MCFYSGFASVSSSRIGIEGKIDDVFADPSGQAKQAGYGPKSRPTKTRRTSNSLAPRAGTWTNPCGATEFTRDLRTDSLKITRSGRRDP